MHIVRICQLTGSEDKVCSTLSPCWNMIAHKLCGQRLQADNSQTVVNGGRAHSHGCHPLESYKAGLWDGTQIFNFNSIENGHWKLKLNS